MESSVAAGAIGAGVIASSPSCASTIAATAKTAAAIAAITPLERVPAEPDAFDPPAVCAKDNGLKERVTVTNKILNNFIFNLSNIFVLYKCNNIYEFNYMQSLSKLFLIHLSKFYCILLIPKTNFEKLLL